jgi:hypothetical protein
MPGNYNNASFEGALANWIALGQKNNDIDPVISVHLTNFTGQGVPDR